VIQSVRKQSVRIRPSSIGSLTDDKAHHVTFQQPAAAWRFYSEEPSKEGQALRTEGINGILERKIAERGKPRLREQLPELDASILRVALSNEILSAGSAIASTSCKPHRFTSDTRR
jgi:hypothetical protein